MGRRGIGVYKTERDCLGSREINEFYQPFGSLKNAAFYWVMTVNVSMYASTNQAV